MFFNIFKAQNFLPKFSYPSILSNHVMPKSCPTWRWPLNIFTAITSRNVYDPWILIIFQNLIYMNDTLWRVLLSQKRIHLKWYILKKVPRVVLWNRIHLVLPWIFLDILEANSLSYILNISSNYEKVIIK